VATTYCGTDYIVENANSPTFESDGLNSTMTRTYSISAASESSALSLVKLMAPATATVDSVPLEAPRKISVSRIGPGQYSATVSYRHAGRDEQEKQELINVGDERVSADFAGQTLHVTTAVSQTKYPASARDVGRGVNVLDDGTVEGTDINQRTGSFSVDVLIDEATGTNAWFKARFEQVWTFNNGTFRSWPAGSVALTGMQSRQRSDGNWDVSYSFQIFPNETGVTNIGGVSLGATVNLKGSEYKWVMFRPKDDAGKIVPEPIGAYVANVYGAETDFSLLGIST
jgi:hypothetical protein